MLMSRIGFDKLLRIDALEKKGEIRTLPKLCSTSLLRIIWNLDLRRRPLTAFGVGTEPHVWREKLWKTRSTTSELCSHENLYLPRNTPIR
jgi:hypothetical protein